MRLGRAVTLFVMLTPLALMGSSICGGDLTDLISEGERMHVPMLEWSPDGSRILFSDQINSPRSLYSVASDSSSIVEIVESKYSGGAGYVDNVSPHLSPDGARIAYMRLLTTTTGNATEIMAPAWSPDGNEIAFAAQLYRNTDEVTWQSVNESYLYIVGADGSNLRSIAELADAGATSSLVWSPDGEYLAFVNQEYEVTKRYGAELVYQCTCMVRTDGSELTQVWDRAAFQLEWSSDGSEVVINSGTYTVNPDGSSFLRSAFSHRLSSKSAWSPDGSRITFGRWNGIFTAAGDGTDLRHIARWHPPVIDESSRKRVSGGEWIAAGLEQEKPPVDLGPCSAGVAAPDPERNPGLVRDCETLLTIRDALAGDAELEWNTDTPITEWDGVTVDGSPLRVRELRLRGRGLTGVLPPELGRLTALQALGLSDPFTAFQLVDIRSVDIREAINNNSLDSGDGDNQLSGTIPKELVNLADLGLLNLEGNFLSGPIPPELGNLSGLKTLDLSDNFLTGPIPVELAKLTAMEKLDLSINGLSGPVPAALGESHSPSRISKMVLSTVKIGPPYCHINLRPYAG